MPSTGNDDDGIVHSPLALNGHVVGGVAFKVQHLVAADSQYGTTARDAQVAVNLLADRASGEIDLVLSLARDRREAPLTPQSLEEIDEWVTWRNEKFADDAGRSLHNALDEPLLAHIPDAPAIPQLASNGSRHVDEGGAVTIRPPSLASYMSAAIGTGNVKALDAINAWMRTQARPGVSGTKDWPTMKRVWLQTRNDIRPLLATLRRATPDRRALVWAEADPQLRQLIEVVQPDVLNEVPTTHELATKIVAHKFGVSPSTLDRQLRRTK